MRSNMEPQPSISTPTGTSAPAAPPTSGKRPKKQSAWRVLGFSAWMRDLVISIGISFFFIIFLYEPVKVEGTSMLPGLQDQERIFINKFVYRRKAISIYWPMDKLGLLR